MIDGVMNVIVYENDKFIMERKEHVNPITKSIIVNYEISPKYDLFHMNMKVLGNKIIAVFSEGLSFDESKKDLWIQAVNDSEKFIKEATPYIA